MRIAKISKDTLGRYVCLALSFAPLSAVAALEPIEGVPSKSISDVLDDLTSWVLGFGLALCVVMMIWGGITYIASAGDAERIGKSKKTIHFAIYGIAIIGLSYAMIKVLNDLLTTNNT